MKLNSIISTVLAAALLASAPALAQDSKADTERALRDAERQMRDAERQMREAERALQAAARQMAEAHSDEALQKALKGLQEKRVVVFGDNARLGIVLRSERDAAADAIGAGVQALTPGGPAEEAGLKPGDVIVKFNGEALGVIAGGEDSPGPTDRLMERAGTLKDGDQVTLEVKRGNETKTFTVTARTLYGPKVKVFAAPEIPDFDFDVDVEPFVVHGGGSAPEAFAYAFSSTFRGLEMVTLSDDLGGYFGTKEGILVVRVPEEAPFKLKAGDVILKIGDRAPGSPAQAMRILRSYGPGETVTIDVMRQHARATLAAEVPERSYGGWKLRKPAVPPPPPEPPEPATAPEPPKPPKAAHPTSDSV